MSLPHQQHMLLLTFLISEIHSETRHNKYKIEGGEGDRVAILLTLSQTSPGFYVSAVQSFENTAGKGEIVLNEKFLLFPVFFYLFGELFAIFIKLKIVVCKLFQFGRD